jgi:hypothetical protein
MFGDPFCRFRGLTASDFTSCATTAKPRPASPARAASIVAFNASRFVCATIRLNDADDLTYLIGLFRKTADRQRRMRGHARRIDNDAARARHLIFYFSNRSRESFGGAGDVMTFEEASEVEPAAACARCPLSVAIVFRLSAASVI